MYYDQNHERKKGLKLSQILLGNITFPMHRTPASPIPRQTEFVMKFTPWSQHGASQSQLSYLKYIFSPYGFSDNLTKVVTEPYKTNQCSNVCLSM